MSQSLQNVVAIHEAAHVVTRFVLFGNIDIIDYVSINPHGEYLGRNKEKTGQKIVEVTDAYDNEDDFFGENGYAFRECCYSLAGVIAEKVFFNLDAIPLGGATQDLESLHSFLGMVCDTETIDALIEKAIPKTEQIIFENYGLIAEVADELMKAPDYRLDNSSIYSILAI